MKIAKVKFIGWDKEYNFSLNNLELKEGDKAVVKTELGFELGDIVGFDDLNDDKYVLEGKEHEVDKNGEQIEKNIIKPILRKATLSDLDKMASFSEKKEVLEFCRKTKDRHNLPMKFIDVHYSFDGSRVTFAFIADGRVDFRELVKDLTRHFGKTIRLQQIGIRDEAKITGDVGHCGQRLCCQGHLKKFESITSEMAEIQGCAHRGSDRISGVCGRLMCCLAYEQRGYEELAKNLPPIGSKVNVDGKRGVVVGHNPLKQAVKVQFSNDGDNSGRVVVEVDLNRHKK
ncbi:MAG: regulatory iron-sulfur-containing complex subunit RicT [Patescibacteria group bacterium]|nr:regulatory iron-sulfur-containing complex subunit RicT [Patescibacteria group bacterium]